MTSSTKDNILVLGYYDRGNLGDEQYKLTFPMILKYNTLTFKSVDDISSIPEDISIVVIGGGDVINLYFMKKIQKLVENFVGKVYAVSVGIPYDISPEYLYIFDHIFTRSETDYQLAVSKVGTNNVSITKDLAFKINVEPNRRMNPMTRIGLCFATPYFYKNDNKQQLFDSILYTLQTYYEAYNQNLIYHFLPFNTSGAINEDDTFINKEFAEKFDEIGIPYELHNNDLKNPIDMLNFINNNTDINICMRYHSIIFSAIAGKRFIALYTTSKIDNILSDLEYNGLYAIKLEVDEHYKPVNVDGGFLNKVLNAAVADNQIDQPYIEKNIYNDITNKIFVDKKQANVLMHARLDSFENVITSTKRALVQFLNITTQKADEIMVNHGVFDKHDKTYLQLARLLSFIITGEVNHPTVWGLAENMAKEDFVLFDAVKYIWTLHKQQYDELENLKLYAPTTSIQRKTLFNVDYIFNNNFSQYHRSGWAYVIGGLMNFDASHLLRKSNINVDIYVDRSFHWGKDILNYLGVLPYKDPWYGFIHHTFNITHSEYNCYNLLKVPEFISSLETCQGLFVLTKYLENQLRTELTKLGINTPIFTVYHPTEFVENNFSLEKFVRNTSKKAVQIGAWLRNPYSIYELPLPIKNNLKVHKAALKGKDMNNYFPPKDLEKILVDNLLIPDGNDDNCISRDPISRDPMCRDTHVNKFSQGLVDSILNNVLTVEVIEKLNNEDYDNILSKNVVFLNLIDCSAVNTVIECIVRNTPLIVNRHPALEEILGENYPGFYSSLYEASKMLQSYYSIYQIYNYMTRLDKTRYKLDSFLDDVQNIILTGAQPKNYNLFLDMSKDRFIGIKRFLPKTSPKFSFETIFKH